MTHRIPVIGQSGEHRVGEVQPGGGSGRRRRLFGEDRLVTLRVVERRVDVRRERHLTEGGERLEGIGATHQRHDERVPGGGAGA